MDTGSTLSMFGDSAAMMLSVMIFLAAGTVAFAAMLAVRAREAVRRRAAGVGIDEDGTGGRGSMRSSGLKAAQKLVDYTTKHYSAADSNDVKVLRRRLIEAGNLRSARSRLFLHRPRDARARPCRRRLYRSADGGPRGQNVVLAVRDVRRRARLSGAELLSRPPCRRAAA